ncbi:T9SS type A sorting domain-containing protein [Rudanella lutea]|uniref:T9SS type A sorting domain-containing protein n=1 Tax=Rudanella lutea TaxID=451374 RepID=UPI0003793BD7|nr:T9SS type A sorting domain-containing protein [Rudanella lutea]
MKTVYQLSRFCVGLLLLLGQPFAWGQTNLPDPQWSVSFRSSESMANRIVLPASGNLVTGGIEYSLSGDTIRPISGFTYPIGSTADGGYITLYSGIIYMQSGLDPRRFEAWWGLQKLDAAGRLVYTREWYHTYGPGGPMYPDFFNIRSITGTTDNGFLILNANGTLTKYNPDGNPSWNRQFTALNRAGTSVNVQLETLLVTPDGDVLLGGSIPGSGAYPTDPSGPATGWIARLDPAGTVRWEKPVDALSAAGQNRVRSTFSITDISPAANGSGFALAGIGYGFSSLVQAPNRAILLEIDDMGTVKRGKAMSTIDATTPYLTTYTGADGKVCYILGNTYPGPDFYDYRLYKISADPIANPDDPAFLATLAFRDYSLSTTYIERLTDVAVATDGGLVLTGTTGTIKLKPERTVASPLVLLSPVYNCQTGQITFLTSGGDGSPITFEAPGISRTSATATTGEVEPGLRNDPKPIPIQARQGNVAISVLFDLNRACTNAVTPLPPVLNRPIPTLRLTVDDVTALRQGFPIGQYFSDPTPYELNYNSNWQLTVVGLPAGLSTFSRNDVGSYSPVWTIVGTARTVGVYSVTVTASTAAFRDKPVVTTFTIEVVPPTPQPLALYLPVYNCQTGAISLRVTGGNGSPITYVTPGIGRVTPTDSIGTVEPGLRADPKPILIQATQSGLTTTYLFDLPGYCQTAPPVGGLQLLPPVYNCATGAITFRTWGGDGSPVEFMAPGITGWTTNPNAFVDPASRTATDIEPFTITARQRGQTVSIRWDLKATCGRARLAGAEPDSRLRVQVLGNPVESVLRVRISSPTDEPLDLQLTDVQGRMLDGRRVANPQAQPEQTFRLQPGAPGVLLLRATNGGQTETVRIVHQ